MPDAHLHQLAIFTACLFAAVSYFWANVCPVDMLDRELMEILTTTDIGLPFMIAAPAGIFFAFLLIGEHAVLMHALCVGASGYFIMRGSHSPTAIGTCLLSAYLAYRSLAPLSRRDIERQIAWFAISIIFAAVMFFTLTGWIMTLDDQRRKLLDLHHIRGTIWFLAIACFRVYTVWAGTVEAPEAEEAVSVQ